MSVKTITRPTTSLHAAHKPAHPSVIGLPMTDLRGNKPAVSTYEQQWQDNFIQAPPGVSG